MNTINIKNIIKKHSKNVATKLESGHELTGRETLKLSEVKNILREALELAIDECAYQAETEIDAYTNCTECGNSDTHVDRDSILHVKTMIKYD